MNSKLTRIGVFYDGNYFSHVSNYYNYEHERKARLSISGLHEFIRYRVSEEEQVDSKFCQIVDAHYFRGRFSSYEAKERNKLLNERVFEDILMKEGVVTHYMPLQVRDGRVMEKGVDVWLALEAYEMSIYKQFDVLVLIASDSDYIPLIKKLNTIGTRVMVLGWDFTYIDERTGRAQTTITSIDLLEQATHAIAMHSEIDNKVNRKDPIINNLFVAPEAYISPSNYSNEPQEVPEIMGTGRGEVLNLKNGYGFISKPPNNLYFHYTNILNGEFADLREGDMVDYEVGLNDKGQEVAIGVKIR
jgi:uncharacterized LabA/DUF88 family protein/cold shock CspA family protein